MSKIKFKVAQYLLEIKAVKLQPEDYFTWTSGWKSPIYCDNRIILSYPEIRSYVKRKLAKKISREFPDAEIIVGVATAGIAPGALVADHLELPFAYARPEPKAHGLKNQIEGKIRKGQRAVVVEDLISTGKSSLGAIEAIRAAGAEVIGLASIFSYGFSEAEKKFKEARVPYLSLSNYDTLLEIAELTGYIKQSQLESLQMWREAPEKWQQAEPANSK